MATRRRRFGAGLPMAGGGGRSRGSTLYTQSTTVSAAQLKALGAVGVDIVPAAGEDILLVPVSVTLLYNYGTLPYGNLAAETSSKDLALAVGGLGVTHWMSSALAIQPSNDRATFMYPNDTSDDGGLPDTGGDFAANTSLQLWNWSGDEYVDGDGTLTVSVSYLKLNVTTGQFQ